MGAGSPSPAGAPLTIAAQEVYRVLLFLVFYAEIWLLGHVPLLGMHPLKLTAALAARDNDVVSTAAAHAGLILCCRKP
jgi:hypothetical protein